MKKILLLNEISNKIDDVLTDGYTISKTETAPDGILVRSAKMLDYAFNPELLAVARCGAGVNNIPLDECAKRGIVVFNTPGANANAVKEQVLMCLFLGSRKYLPAIEWANSLKGTENISAQVEKGKNNFVGREVYRKKMGVIGLGAIGVLVANCAYNLGMDVYGYDPYISVDAAWALSRKIIRCTNLNNLFAECDYITIHIPYNDQTRNTIDEKAVSAMKDGVVLINCARGELVDNAAVINGIKSGKIARYITDFPCEELLGVENVICIPHLGASTPEAEDNCAVAAAREIKDYIENGNITNSVNFPACSIDREGKYRISVIHLNVAERINKITSLIGQRGINIAHFINKSKGNYAYSLFDLDVEPDDKLLEQLAAIEGVIKVRSIV